jgi:hypothetical protein
MQLSGHGVGPRASGDKPPETQVPACGTRTRNGDAGREGSGRGSPLAPRRGSATGALILSGWVGLVGASVFLVYLAVVVWPRLRAMQLTNKKLICESEWAREKGYSTTTLRLFEFPWSK